ncbi:hypothetical protein ACFLVI_03380 [Chloroflexota bacterium]
MKDRIYSRAEERLIDDWSQRWLDLFQLVNNVTAPAESPWPPPPPTDPEELEYQRLHFWFLDHQDRFEHIWSDYIDDTKDSFNGTKDEKDEFDSLSAKYGKNPFLDCYEPDNLYHLAQRLDLQNGTEIWDSNEQEAITMRRIFAGLAEILVRSFHPWVKDRLSTKYN